MFLTLIGVVVICALGLWGGNYACMAMVRAILRSAPEPSEPSKCISCPLGRVRLCPGVIDEA